MSFNLLVTASARPAWVRSCDDVRRHCYRRNPTGSSVIGMGGSMIHSSRQAQSLPTPAR